MALANIINPPDPQKKKGGLLSKISGGLGGALDIAGLVVPGASTAGKIISGAGKVANAAGTVGNFIDPQTVSGGGSRPGVPQMSAADRRLSSDPQATLATLNQSLAAVQNLDQQTRAAYEPFLAAAKREAEARII